MRRGSKSFLRLAAVSLLAATIALIVMMNEAKAPAEKEIQETPRPAPAAAETGNRVSGDCRVIQTMVFSRCGHSVSRRIHAPEEVIGQDFTGLQNHYNLWTIESFSPGEVSMRREIPLFCPMHTVLTCDETGAILLSRNEYGDGMAVVKTYPYTLEGFAEETQEALRLGLGFDTEDEAEQYLSQIAR